MINTLIHSIPKEYLVNPFEKTYLINPFSKELTKKQQRFCLITTIFLGVLTLGILQLAVCIKAVLDREAKFKKKIKDGKIVHIRPTKKWKSVPGIGAKPKLGYVKPIVDMSAVSKNLPKALKKQIEDRCLNDMKNAMKALDPSIVDAANEMMRAKETPQFFSAIDQFSGRVLDVYKAYVQVLIDEEKEALPMEIARLKATGLSHDDILSLKEPCVWYMEMVQTFKENISVTSLDDKEIELLIQHISTNEFNWDADALLTKKDPSTLDKQIVEILNKHQDDIEAISIESNKYIHNLKSDQFLKKIKHLHWWMNFLPTLTPEDIELSKEQIATFALNKPSKNKPIQMKDSQLMLLQEIQARFEWREFETGAVNSPLRYLNIVEGKHDNETEDHHFRAKLFFCYGSKGLVNEVAKSPKLLAKVNAKLKEQGKLWQMDSALASHLAKIHGSPVFRLGIYANENNIGVKTRHYSSLDDIAREKAAEPELTYSEAERIANKIDVSQQNLMQRFRIKINGQEEMAFFGTNASCEAREQQRRKDLLGVKNGQLTTTADTGFFESPLDYHKKTNPIKWSPGKHYFQHHDAVKGSSPYLKGVEELGLPKYSSLSGSSDQMFTMAGILDIKTKEELMDLRFVFLPWMSGYHDHTADEIMTSVKAFGLPYTQAPDYYKQIHPDYDQFIPLLKKAQQERGFELPDYYLSKEHVENIMAEEIHTYLTSEKVQNDDVMKLLKSNKLLLRTLYIQKAAYTGEDMFADQEVVRQLQTLKPSSIEKFNAMRKKKRKAKSSDTNTVKFALNPQTKQYEPHIRSEPPFYKGTKKYSVSLLATTGKVTPYVDEKAPDANRIGYLFDIEKCQIKKDKFIFRKDANTDLQQPWKKTYTKQEMEQPDFQDRLTQDSRAAEKFLSEKAQQTSMEELIEHVEKHKDDFAPYNEIFASLNSQALKGIFVYSKGMPMNSNVVDGADNVNRADWEPLHHETLVEFEADDNYDTYMKIVGIGKRIAVKKELGLDIPLYEINQTKNQGLTLISRIEQETLITDLLNDKMRLEAVAKIAKRRCSDSPSGTKRKLKKTLKAYLKSIQEMVN